MTGRPGRVGPRRRRTPRPQPWPHLRAPKEPARLRAPGGPVAVVGHMGAPAVAPANSREGFLAACELGADGVELDLIAVRGGDVLVAHDLGEVHRRTDVLPIDELTDLLAEPPLAGTPVLLDVKSIGTERAVAAALTGARLTPRAIISTTDPHVLRAVRLAAPGATRSQTFPRSRRDPERNRISRQLARLRRPVTRRLLPVLARRAAHRHGLAAITVHHPLVSPALVRMVRARNIELIVWTVDEPGLAAELIDLGVDAIITNDPEMVIGVRRTHEPKVAAAPRSKVGIRSIRALFRG